MMISEAGSLAEGVVRCDEREMVSSQEIMEGGSFFDGRG